MCVAKNTYICIAKVLYTLEICIHVEALKWLVPVMLTLLHYDLILKIYVPMHTCTHAHMLTCCGSYVYSKAFVKASLYSRHQKLCVNEKSTSCVGRANSRNSLQCWFVLNSLKRFEMKILWCICSYCTCYGVCLTSEFKVFII